jgi:hypothetical protein
MTQAATAKKIEHIACDGQAHFFPIWGLLFGRASTSNNKSHPRIVRSEDQIPVALSFVTNSKPSKCSVCCQYLLVVAFDADGFEPYSPNMGEYPKLWHVFDFRFKANRQKTIIFYIFFQ